VQLWRSSIGAEAVSACATDWLAVSLVVIVLLTVMIKSLAFRVTGCQPVYTRNRYGARHSKCTRPTVNQRPIYKFTIDQILYNSAKAIATSELPGLRCTGIPAAALV